MVNSLLHEAAHAVAGLVLGLTPTITPLSVSYEPEGTREQQIITAAAGPLFSLAMGLILMIVLVTGARASYASSSCGCPSSA